jgi:hypothetical protein
VSDEGGSTIGDYLDRMEMHLSPIPSRLSIMAMATGIGLFLEGIPGWLSGLLGGIFWMASIVTMVWAARALLVTWADSELPTPSPKRLVWAVAWWLWLTVYGGRRTRLRRIILAADIALAFLVNLLLVLSVSEYGAL